MLDFLLTSVLPELAASELDPDFVDVAQEVASAEGAIWLSSTGTRGDGIFLCLSPQDAVSWLCRHSSRDLLLQAVQEGYDEESVPASDRSEPEPLLLPEPEPPLLPSQAPKRKRAPRGDGPGAAKYNKTVDKKLAEKRIEAWTGWFQNSQDADATVPPAYSKERARYGIFLSAQPAAKAIGMDQATQMIHSAYVVASSEALEDWQKIMRMWRRMHGDQQGVAPVHHQHQIALTQAQDCEPSMELFCAAQDGQLKLRDDAGSIWDTVYSSAVDGESRNLFDGLKQRWRCCRVFSFYTHLHDALEAAGVKSGRTGIRTPTLAREILFLRSVTEEEILRWEDIDKTGKAWGVQGDMIESGRRWQLVQDKLGVGIFALMPQSRVPNRLVEKILTLERIKLWADMVFNCNPGAVQLAERIKPLFVSCCMGESPPDYFLQLELVVDWKRDVTKDLSDSNTLLELLDPALNIESDIEEISD